MVDVFYFKENVEINDINKISYTDFLKHETILYVNTNLTKKQFHDFRKKIKNKSYYPIHIIRENKNDTEQMKRNKLRHAQQQNEKLFKTRYLQIAKKQFGISSLFDIKDEIKKCPFCNNKKVLITHDYSKYHTNCTLFLKCDSCNQILDSEHLIFLFDAFYSYDENIKIYIDLYCKNYNNEFIKKKIFDKLKTINIKKLFKKIDFS